MKCGLVGCLITGLIAGLIVSAIFIAIHFLMMIPYHAFLFSLTGSANTMKAISYHQPYAWMLANGYLDIDDRTWDTSFRGILAIHASKAFSAHYYQFVRDGLGIDIPAQAELGYGVVLGQGRLAHIVKPGEPTDVPDARRAHGGPHCYGWQFTDIELFETPVPCRGQQGLFDIDIPALIQEEAPRKGKQFDLF